MAELLLEVKDLHAGYGKAEVLHGIHLPVRAGQVVTVIGPNGAGKSTLLGALMGLLPLRGAVRFAGEVDRIYTGAPAELDIVDGASGHTLRISAEGSRTAVVWNPGAALAAGMADLAADEYRRFVCVETANAADEVVTLPPGGEHRLVAEMFTVPTRFGGPLPSHGT